MKGDIPTRWPRAMAKRDTATTAMASAERRRGRRLRIPAEAWLAIAIALALAACSPAASSISPEATVATTIPTALGVPLDGEDTAELQALLDDASVDYGARGALAFVQSGDRAWAVATGDADVDGTPVTVDMRFRIGSITKPVVAALILDQVAQGKLLLDDDVFELVGEPLREEPPVTVAMLLNHTSGIFDIGNDGDPIADIDRLSDPDLVEEAQSLIAAVAAGEDAIASDRLIVALAETHDRYFPPGAGFHYSNTNYQLASLLLEKAAGDSLAELLALRVAGPLGLKHTTVAPADARSPDLRGFSTDLQTGSIIDATDDLLAFGNGGSGGVISTARELTTILAAIVHGQFLPEELRTDMTTPTPESGDSYGLGLATYELACGTFYGHEGRVNGTASIALIDMARPDRSVVVALNRGDPESGMLALAENLICSADSHE